MLNPEKMAEVEKLAVKYQPPMRGASDYVGIADAPLDDVEAFLSQFVAYPSDHALVAHVLWIAHAHLMQVWESTPRIAFLSPEPASGKSRALEVSELLVPLPVMAVNVTPAYLFRKVGGEDGKPTILYDEIDTVFGPKARDNEEIRGLLNAGHRRDAVAGRCVVRGKQVFTEEIPAYSAVALAGLGDLPETILSRAVIIRMRRRGPNEMILPFRRRVYESDGHALRDRLVMWSASIAPSLEDIWPEMPEGIVDRAADVWESLLAVADAAGGDWPGRARKAAVSLVTDAKRSTPSLGVRLLADLRQIFKESEKMWTEQIIKDLIQLELSPWGDLRGKPIDARKLARLLKPYDITPKLTRQGEEVFRGYARTDLFDAWARYLGPPHIASVTSVTPVTDEHPTPLDVADVTDVTDAMWSTHKADEEVF